jgi:hypothetical protein
VYLENVFGEINPDCRAELRKAASVTDAKQRHLIIAINGA